MDAFKNTETSCDSPDTSNASYCCFPFYLAKIVSILSGPSSVYIPDLVQRSNNTSEIEFSCSRPIATFTALLCAVCVDTVSQWQHAICKGTVPAATVARMMLQRALSFKCRSLLTILSSYFYFSYKCLDSPIVCNRKNYYILA